MYAKMYIYRECNFTDGVNGEGGVCMRVERGGKSYELAMGNAGMITECT